MINHLKEGFNEYDEKKLFQKINQMTPDAVKKILKRIPRIAQIDDFETNRFASADNIMTSGVQYVDDVNKTFAEKNPLTTGAGLSAAGTAGVLKATGTPIKTALGKAFRGAGTRLGVLPFAGLTVRDNLAKGENIADAVVDPLVGLELSFPGLFKENLSKITKNPTAQKILNLAIPLGRAARFTTPFGAALGIAGLGVDAYKASRDRLNFLDSLTPDQKTELFKQERQDAVKQNLRGDPNAFDQFSAAGGGLANLTNTIPPESGPMSQGLRSLYNNGRKL